MTITLASLIARLTADVPAVDGVPSASQYSQAVTDAVADLSRRASVPRVALLTIVAGTASYTLPSDFQRLIRLAQIGVLFPYQPPALTWGNEPSGGTLVTPQGLVPFSGSYREQITVSGSTLTIYPTPQVSADRQLVYAAGDALNDAGTEYATLTEDRAAIALLLAKATCLERQSVASGSSSTGKISGLGYTIDTSAGASGQRTEAQGLRGQYLSSVDSLNAAIGGLA
jgi:hypothetical protein